MNGLSILLVDRDPTHLAQMRLCLSQERSFRIIGSCSDAQQASMFAHLHRPDLIICAMLLNGSDAIDLLRMLSRCDAKPLFLLVSGITSDSILRSAMAFGMDYFLLEPYTPDRLLDVVRMLASQRSVPPERALSSLHRRIHLLLVRAGFSSQYCGFHYLSTALYLAMNDPSLLSSLTKSLYAAVAEQHRTSASRVERDLRHIIRVTCLRSGRPVRSNGIMLRELLRQLRREI